MHSVINWTHCIFFPNKSPGIIGIHQHLYRALPCAGNQIRIGITSLKPLPCCAYIMSYIWWMWVRHQPLIKNEPLHRDVCHFPCSAFRAQASAACGTASKDIKQVVEQVGKMIMPVRATVTGVWCFNEGRPSYDRSLSSCYLIPLI